MNVGPIAYGNGLMIGVFCGWIAFGLAFGPLLALFCCSASSGKFPRGLTQVGHSCLLLHFMLGVAYA